MRIPIAKIKSAVGKAFSGLGEDFTIRTVVTEGAFDPVTGGQTNRVVSDRVMRGIDAGTERKWMPDATVLLDEYVIYLYDEGDGPPSTRDFILLDNREVAIQNVDEYSVANANIAYRLVVAR